MWIKKIKNKKIQFLVLGLILGFAAMLLTACLSFSTEVDKFTDKQFSRNKNADIYLYASKGTSNYLKEKLQTRSDADQITLTSSQGFNLYSYPIYHKDKKLSDYITPTFAIPLPDYNKLPYQLTVASGDKEHIGPGSKELWVQKIVADNHDIHVGDSFTIPAKGNNAEEKFTVTALVNDNTKPVSMVNGTFVYINEKDLAIFDNNQAFEFITLSTNNDVEELSTWIENNYTNKYYGVMKETLSSLKLKASFMTSLVAKLGTLSALFMFLIIIVIILFFIRNTILNEYSAIGTYKAVGFSSMKIISFYLKAYAIVGIFTIIIGSLLGLFVSTFIGNIVMEYIGEYKLSTISIPCVAIVIIVTSILLLGSIYISLKKIKKISPVDAFRVGTTSSKAKLKKSVIKNAHSPFSMAINDIFKYKNRSILIVTVVAFSFYIAILLLNMCYNFNHMEDNPTAWVAFPKHKYYISTPNEPISDEILNFVKNNPAVDNYLVGNGIFESSVRIDCKDPEMNLKYVNVQIYNTYDEKLTGIKYFKGRPPKNAHEVAIDGTTLENSSYDVGDMITLTIDDKPTDFLICGSYHTMMTPCIAFLTDTFADCDKASYLTTVCVDIKKDYDEKLFISEFKKSFPESNVITMKKFVDNVKESVMSIMVPVTIIIMCIFFSFTLLNIINIILTNNAEQKKNFGIMKAFGFSNNYIIARNIIRIILLSVIGMGISVLLDALISAKIFESILSVDAYVIISNNILLLLTGGIITILLLSYLLSLSIRRISPKQLMEN